MTPTKVRSKSLKINAFVTSGTGAAYSVEVPRFPSYTNDESFFVKFHTANTIASPTLSISGLGSHPINNVTAAGEIELGVVYIATFYGTHFRVAGGTIGGGGGGGGGGVAYATDPTTTGNRIVFSVGANADTIDETLISYDPLTGTWNRNGTTQTGTTNFNNNYTANYNGSTINMTNVQQNNTSAFIPLGCSALAPNPNAVALDPTATKAEVTVNYDNTANDPTDIRTKTITITGGTVTVTETGRTGSIDVVRNTGVNITVTQTSGLGTSTSIICQFAGGMIVTNNGVIENNIGTTTTNTNTTENNTNVQQFFDQTSSITNLGANYFENLEVNNITIAQGGSIIGANRANIEEFTAIAGQTVFNLANLPASNAFIWVSNTSGQYAKQTLSASRDYDVLGQTITLTTPALLGDVITVQYIESLGTLFPTLPTFTGIAGFKKGITAGMTGFNLIVADASCFTTSIITRTAQTSPVGFIEIIPANGSFTINSSASETAIIFNYLITN